MTLEEQAKHVVELYGENTVATNFAKKVLEDIFRRKPVSTFITKRIDAEYPSSDSKHFILPTDTYFKQQFSFHDRMYRQIMQDQCPVILYSEKPLVKYVHKFFSTVEVNSILGLVNQNDFEVAPVTVAENTFEMQPDIRNNSRIIFDSERLAKEVFEDLEKHLPKTFKGWRLDGLNTRFRYYKYTEGQKFEMHFDGKYRETIDRESKLTLLIYLTEDCKGGSTSFYDNEGNFRFKVEPSLGSVLIFDHHQNHSGDPIVEGTKIVLRTDVMYRRN